MLQIQIGGAKPLLSFMVKTVVKDLNAVFTIGLSPTIMTNDLIYNFNSWVDRIILENIATPVAAYNFNLYEHHDAFAIQLIGAKSFDRSDSAWACDEVFSSGEDLFDLPRSIVGYHWRDGLRGAKSLVEKYLETGKQAPLLKATHGVGIGFVDGDLKLVYLRSDE